MNEELELKFETVLRQTKDDDIIQDIKQGYVYFEAHLDANGKKISVQKRIRLDKPERMLNKFVTKVKALTEEKYKEEKYYVANKVPPAIQVVLLNEDEVNEKMLVLFEEIEHYVKTKNPAVLATETVLF